ncbi:MAG: lytic murein transglycosylase B [Pseudomonadota bacterium]
MRTVRDIRRRFFVPCTFVMAALLAFEPAAAFDTSRGDISGFIDEMVSKHAFDRAYVEGALTAAESKQRILDAISRPAEKTMTWPEYRGIFVRPAKISAGVEFWQAHEADIDAISAATGVAPEILVGIIGVETNFGSNTGGYRVIDALATLAFDYPPRSRFFRQQLEEFLLLVREEGMDALVPTGSYAGAMGRPQFMPGSFRAYAVDSDGDGRRDIWENWRDVLGSVANYFVVHGWQAGNDVAAPATFDDNWSGAVPANSLKADSNVGALRAQGVRFESTMGADHPARVVTLELGDDQDYWVGFHNFFVITRYNRNVMYALAVHELGQAIAAEYGQ